MTVAQWRKQRAPAWIYHRERRARVTSTGAHKSTLIQIRPTKITLSMTTRGVARTWPPLNRRSDTPMLTPRHQRAHHRGVSKAAVSYGSSFPKQRTPRRGPHQRTIICLCVPIERQEGTIMDFIFYFFKKKAPINGEIGNRWSAKSPGLSLKRA